MSTRAPLPVFRVPTWIAATLLAPLIAGCDKPPIADQSQVLARVNGDEISVHQLSFAQAQSPTKVVSNVEREALLEKMIDRQLAVQQALEKQLDRRPEVMMRLQEARLDILAAAYSDLVTGTKPSAYDKGAAAFYNEHPGLFAERKIYRLREVSLPADSPTLTEAQARLERRESLEDVLAWLREQRGSFTDQVSIRPAEQLPIEVADRLHRVRPGDTIAFRLPRALVIYQLQSAEAAPLDWKAAEPIIRAHLTKQEETALFKDELQRLRAGAQIIRNPSPQ